MFNLIVYFVSLFVLLFFFISFRFCTNKSTTTGGGGSSAVHHMNMLININIATCRATMASEIQNPLEKNITTATEERRNGGQGSSHPRLRKCAHKRYNTHTICMCI